MDERARTAGALSHRRHWNDSVVQSVGPPGVVDLGPGYLDPDLLPVDLLRSAYADALAEFGSAALGYGNNQGVLPLRHLLAQRAELEDSSPCDAANIVITAGTSQALHMLAGHIARPGDAVLVEQPGYDLGHRILADRGLVLRPVPSDRLGPDPEALLRVARTECAAGRRVAFAYLVPTFHNPTGLLVARQRREELVAVAQRIGLLIVEDDAYRELCLGDDCVPPSLAGLAGRRGVVRLGTFAKTLAPGLRLGWLDTDTASAARIAASGLLRSGGGLNHLASLAVLMLLRNGRYDCHLRWLRRQLVQRRDALFGPLNAGLTGYTEVHPPSGGFFAWLVGVGEHPEEQLVARAAAVGVRVLAGSRFGDRSRSAVRLSFSQHPPHRLADAADRISAAWRFPPQFHRSSTAR